MIIGSMVVKNEEDRYLERCLAWNSRFVDKLFVYDDQSSDNTAGIAEQFGTVVIRDNEVPSFIEHEGRFRQAAWLSMRSHMNPVPGDFILSFDADEFLVADTEDVRFAMDRSIDAMRPMHSGVLINFKEVFNITDDGTLMYRTDGFWNRINGSRLFRFLDDNEFRDASMGCGSEPLYVSRGKHLEAVGGLRFLHFGYAKKEDRISKHKRYSSLADSGHNDRHVASIVKPSQLSAWSGVIPL
jgi:glycosyltransferase involved in cell wall biosynthesis